MIAARRERGQPRRVARADVEAVSRPFSLSVHAEPIGMLGKKRFRHQIAKGMHFKLDSDARILRLLNERPEMRHLIQHIL